jgi:shikimate dehydrogenase
MSTAHPDRYAVIGNPVAHSQSPFIHAEFARQTGQEIGYERVLSPTDRFKYILNAWADSGARGCNVTVPFKFEVPRLVPNVSERVRLLLGAGGAAAGVLGPLLAAKPAKVVVVNRTAERAVALAASHAAWALEHGSEVVGGRLEDAPYLCGEGCQVLINGTASSLEGAAAPVADGILQRNGLAVDMMYGPAAEPFLQWARAQGAQARDGLGMLVEQAADAFAFWRGIRPHTPPVLAALRQQLAAV